MRPMESLGAAGAAGVAVGGGGGSGTALPAFDRQPRPAFEEPKPTADVCPPRLRAGCNTCSCYAALQSAGAAKQHITDPPTSKLAVHNFDAMSRIRQATGSSQCMHFGLALWRRAGLPTPPLRCPPSAAAQAGGQHMAQALGCSGPQAEQPGGARTAPGGAWAATARAAAALCLLLFFHFLGRRRRRRWQGQRGGFAGLVAGAGVVIAAARPGSAHPCHVSKQGRHEQDNRRPALVPPLPGIAPGTAMHKPAPHLRSSSSAPASAWSSLPSPAHSDSRSSPQPVAWAAITARGGVGRRGGSGRRGSRRQGP